MSPFLPKCVEQMNVPICIGVYYLTLDSGEVVIIEFVKGFWFGNKIEKSLIKPNQCQFFWIQICNEPTNPHRKLGIESSEVLFISMTMEG